MDEQQQLTRYQKALDLNYLKERIKDQLNNPNFVKRHPKLVIMAYELFFNQDERTERLKRIIGD